MPAIRRIRERHPRLEINIQVETSNVLARELLASRHDFIIARIPDDLNPRLFESKVIGIEKACLIVRRGHPLLGRAPCAAGKPRRLRLGVPAGGTLLRRTIESIFISRNAALPERILNTTSLLLTHGHGGAVGRHRLGLGRGRQLHPQRPGLAGAIEILPVDFEIVVQPYSLITAKNRLLSPAAQMLYREIEESIGGEPVRQ